MSEVGLKLYRQMRDTMLQAASECYQNIEDDEWHDEFKVYFGRNPKHIVKAMERFPEIFDPSKEPDLWDILAAIHLSRVKEDEIAAQLFGEYKSEMDFDALREKVKELKPSAPRASKRTAADVGEDVETIVNRLSTCDWDDEKTPYTTSDIWMLALREVPEVAAALKRREAAK